MCQVTFAAQSIFQLSLVILQGTGHGVFARTTVAASILTLCSTLCLLALSHFEHCRTARPSAIIQLFLLVIIILELPRLRTSWLLDGDDQQVIACLFTIVFALWIVSLQLESFQKWKHVTVSPDSIPPEERQGVFGRTFFWWLMPMFLEGYSRTLSMDDLFAIDDDLKGTTLYERLLKSWRSGKPLLSLPCLLVMLTSKSTTRRSTP
jgi:ATP-binding cassette subfamily C (CFTR/MRP) protein 1